MKAVNWMMAISVGCVLVLTACPGAVPVVGPTATAVACITSDVLEGKSVAQTAIDCGTDVATVIATIINAADPNIHATKAYAEAINLRSSLYVDGGTASPSPGK